MSGFDLLFALGRAAEVVDAKECDHAKKDSTSDTIPAGGSSSSNQSKDGRDGLIAAEEAKSSNQSKGGRDGLIAAEKAKKSADEAEDAANTAYLICFHEMARFDLEAMPLESNLRYSKERVDSANASLLRLKNECTQTCQNRTRDAHAIHVRACIRLEEMQTALNRAEAGVGIYGKRHRSTASDVVGVVPSKSMKVGAESAGKAARSGQVGDVSAPAVVEPDTAADRRLQSLRLAANLAEEDVEDAKTAFAAVQAEVKKTLNKHRDRVARENILLQEFEREAEKDARALKAFFSCPDFGRAYAAHCNASAKLEEAKEATADAQKVMDEAAKKVYPEEFPEEGWEVDQSELNREPCDARDASWCLNLVVPEYTPIAEKARLVKEALRAQRAALKAQRAAAMAAGEVRRSSRSSRGQRAEVYGE